jgi:hypothetical protein
VRLLLNVADAILRHDGSEAMAEAVDRGGADAAGCIAASDNDGINTFLDEIGAYPGFEEDGGRLLQTVKS